MGLWKHCQTTCAPSSHSPAAGIDSQTRCDIMGHESTLMDDRYTMIDDDALDDARRKMESFQKSRGLLDADPAALAIFGQVR
jgi:hypothetical protein